ncbi:response regulator transcription factor [Methylotetracoccus oryzae]|uniref:response regulator transcription factor n=1 Tax=Methylotetracoccus oryzae TaxID=1919059 RepID=UPI0011195D80|nr:helix-turn-helix transcriptional regulator [Methylotetracoccus oryzae]
MKPDDGSDFSTTPGSNKLVGTFVLGDKEFHIILLSDTLAGPAFAEQVSGGALNYTEICRFAVGDRQCLIARKASVSIDALGQAGTLSARELQIAALVAKGAPTKQIAAHLRLSEWTVATYLRRICAKLGVRTRAAMTFKCAAVIELEQAKERLRNSMDCSEPTRGG